MSRKDHERKRRSIRLYDQHLARHKASYYRKVGLDIVMGRREGIYFWDLDGKRYINCHCNGGVFNLGHRNPSVIAAVQAALDQYDIGNHHLISEPRSELARSLVESFGRKTKLTRVVFGSSGGESADLAIKLARGFSRRQKIVSLAGGYHGHTGLALAAGDPKYRIPFGIDLPNFVQVPLGDESALARELKDAAALILETVPATLGMPIFSPESMKRMRAICDRSGAAFILDEIQTGLGRTGRIWGFQNYGIEPDIVLMGKGLSGGIYPISAIAYAERFESVFRKDPFIHISTFGGAEAGCAAAQTVLSTVSDRRFLLRVNETGQAFEDSWRQLAREFPEIREVRRMGMFMGIVFAAREDCLVLIRALLDHGIFAVYANNDKRVLQFLPPLTVTDEEISEIVSLLRAALVDSRRFRYRLLKRVMKWVL